MAKNIKIIPSSGSVSFEPTVGASTSAVELSFDNGDLTVTSGSASTPGSSDLVTINKDSIEIDNSINFKLPVTALGPITSLFTEGRILFDSNKDAIVFGTGASNDDLLVPKVLQVL